MKSLLLNTLSRFIIAFLPRSECLLIRFKLEATYILIFIMTNPDSVLKTRDTPLPTKVRIVKAVVFPVGMYGCELDHKEGWAPKN